MNLFETVNPSSFTFIVPGVGDHKTGDPLRGVQEAYEKYAAASGIPTELRQDVNLSEFLPGSLPQEMKIRGLLIRLQGATHVAATLDWSHTRERLFPDSAPRDSGLLDHVRRVFGALFRSRHALFDFCRLFFSE
jgi:hypothetical protein